MSRTCRHKYVLENLAGVFPVVYVFSYYEINFVYFVTDNGEISKTESILLRNKSMHKQCRKPTDIDNT